MIEESNSAWIEERKPIPPSHPTGNTHTRMHAHIYRYFHIHTHTYTHTYTHSPLTYNLLPPALHIMGVFYFKDFPEVKKCMRSALHV